MKLQQASVLYGCESAGCRTIRAVQLVTIGQAFKDIMSQVEDRKECPTCKKNTLRIVHIILTKISDNFGDSRYGIWTCYQHTKARFYPALLKKAFKEKDYTNNLYEKIVQEGLPPKCPHCGAKLDYVDERTIACAYH